MPNLRKMEKYFIKTGLAFLAKWTWAKYASAYNSFFRFCKDEKIKNPWPISKNSTVCFVLWCKKVLKIKAGTIQSYLLALQTISKLLGLKSQRIAKESAKLLVLGIQRSEKQVGFKPTDPLTFEILVTLKKIIAKTLESSKQKSSLGLHMFGLLQFFLNQWAPHKNFKSLWPILHLLLGWHWLQIKYKIVRKGKKSKNFGGKIWDNQFVCLTR